MPSITREELAVLMTEAAQAHHQAYRETDGVDPEWASWYAPVLQARLGDRLGRTVTRSQIVYLLLKAEREYEEARPGSAWPDFYADVFLEA